MDNSITHVAMDTHKKQHAVGLVYPDTGEVQAFTVNNTAKDIKKMVKKIQRKAPGDVRFCYEAGVCGFTLKQRIEAAGSDCMVIARRWCRLKRAIGSRPIGVTPASCWDSLSPGS